MAQNPEDVLVRGLANQPETIPGGLLRGLLNRPGGYPVDIWCDLLGRPEVPQEVLRDVVTNLTSSTPSCTGRAREQALATAVAAYIPRVPAGPDLDKFIRQVVKQSPEFEGTSRRWGDVFTAITRHLSLEQEQYLSQEGSLMSAVTVARSLPVARRLRIVQRAHEILADPSADVEGRPYVVRSVQWLISQLRKKDLWAGQSAVLSARTVETVVYLVERSGLTRQEADHVADLCVPHVHQDDNDPLRVSPDMFVGFLWAHTETLGAACVSQVRAQTGLSPRDPNVLPQQTLAGLCSPSASMAADTPEQLEALEELWEQHGLTALGVLSGMYQRNSPLTVADAIEATRVALAPV